MNHPRGVFSNCITSVLRANYISKLDWKTTLNLHYSIKGEVKEKHDQLGQRTLQMLEYSGGIISVNYIVKGHMKGTSLLKTCFTK